MINPPGIQTLVVVDADEGATGAGDSEETGRSLGGGGRTSATEY